jgi:hypothetical protein
MTTITDVLTSIRSHPNHVSSSIIDTTPHIVTETQDNNIDTIRATFNKDGDIRDVNLVINKEFINNWPSDANHGDTIFKELVYCDCNSCMDETGMYAYKSTFGNLGKPPTYYISNHDDHTNQAIRIKTDPIWRTDSDVELYTLESLLENIRNQPDHVSSAVIPVSDFIKQEVNDSDLVAIDIKFNREGNERDVRIILNNQYITKIPKTLDYGDLISNGIVYCKYCDSCDQGGYGGYLTENENLGSPPTYYANPKTGEGKRIKAFPMPTIPTNDKLDNLLSDLKKLSDVEKVELEFARYDSIKETVGSQDAIVLTVWKYRAIAPTLKYYSLDILNQMDNSIAINSIKELMDN